MYKLFFEFFHRRNAADGDFKLDTGFLYLLLRVIDDITGENGTVREKDDVIVFIEQCRFSNIDIKDFATVVSDLDKVVDRYFFTEADDNSTDDISEKVLGYDGYGGSYDREGGKHMTQTDAKESEYGDKRIDRYKDEKQIAQPAGDIVPFMIRKMFSAPVNHSQQSNQKACSKKE